MRKTLIILALSCATALAFSTDAFAQRRGGGGRGGSWSSGGHSGSWSGGHDGHGGWGWGGIGIGIGYPGYYGGYYGRGGYGGYYDSGYYAPSDYYYPSNSFYSDAYSYPQQYAQQSYYPQMSQQTATVQVMVPNPSAQIWFNGAQTSQQGMNRMFYTPPLEPGNYSYSVKARWTENGQPVERERTVSVRAGETASVDFRAPQGDSRGLQQTEPLPLPKRPQ